MIVRLSVCLAFDKHSDKRFTLSLSMHDHITQPPILLPISVLNFLTLFSKLNKINLDNSSILRITPPCYFIKVPDSEIEIWLMRSSGYVHCWWRLFRFKTNNQTLSNACFWWNECENLKYNTFFYLTVRYI